MSETTEKDPRTVAPNGWPVALLGTLEPDFGGRLEAFIGATEQPHSRVRPAASDALAPDRIVVVVLDELGQAKGQAQAIADVEAAANACGLAIGAASRDSLVVSVAPPPVEVAADGEGDVGEAAGAADGSVAAPSGRRRRSS